MKDKYDEAVEYLKKHPKQIHSAWDETWEHEAGCLFRPVSKITDHSPDRRGAWPLRASDGLKCGCLTTIRSQEMTIHGHGIVAETNKLTREIIADNRIPKYVEDLTVDDLEVFAEWQRKIDKELGRE